MSVLARVSGNVSWQEQLTFSYAGLLLGEKETRPRRALLFLIGNSAGTKCFGGSIREDVQGGGKFTGGRTRHVAVRELEIQVTSAPVWLEETVAAVRPLADTDGEALLRAP